MLNKLILNETLFLGLSQVLQTGKSYFHPLVALGEFIGD
jgi:hypothetical protein